MRSPTAGGPAHLVLMASIARRYFVDGRSKVEIGAEFGLSRFQVARLLEAAKASGMVRIEIRHPGVLDVDLSGQLQDAFGLRHSVVVETPEDRGAALRRPLGSAAADLLSEILTPQDVLGLAWARSVSAMATALPRLPPIPVVQLTGALSASAMENSSIDLIREVAKLSAGPAYVFYAPMMVRDADIARALRQQPEVSRTFERFGSVTKAVAGLGQWAPGQSTLYDALDEQQRRRVLDSGVRAELSGVLLDADGCPVESELSERMIGVNAAQLHAIPEVIAIPYDTAKAPAVLAALRSGIVNGVVTHASLARLLLAGV